jgi:hypothetical protein
MAKDNPKTNGQLVSTSVQVGVFTGPQLRGPFCHVGAVLVVLLIACVNVMNSNLGGRTRAKERSAGRAGPRARLMRQMLTESFLVAGQDQSLEW